MLDRRQKTIVCPTDSKASGGVPRRCMISHYGGEGRDHEDSDGGLYERGRALGCRGAARRRGRRRVLLLGADDRRILPAVVRVAACAARECGFPFDLRGCGTGRIPALQTVPAERGGARGAACGGGGERLPADG